MFNIFQPVATHPYRYYKNHDFNSNYILRGHEFKLKGLMISILETLYIQFSQDKLWESMHFIQAMDESGFMKFYAYIKLKICRDGFELYGRDRRNILITLINCSLRSCGNSRNAASILGLFDMEEDRWTLSLINQRLDIELMALYVLGFLDIRTGHNIGIVNFNVEDSASMEKTIGKDNPKGSHRFLFDGAEYQLKYHVQENFHWHLPAITIDTKLADNVWRKFENTNLRHKYCLKKGEINTERQHRNKIPQNKFYLCEFNKSYSHEYIKKNASIFQKIRSHILHHKIFNSAFIGNTQRAMSIYTACLDGLHLSLRIGAHIAKNFMLFSIDYSQYLRDNPQCIQKNHDVNDNSEYPLLTTEQILIHFRDHVKIPFHYDADNPGNLKIKSDGGKKRKYFENLGKFLKCDECSFDILKNSPIQKYVATIIICMVHSLTGFELLTWNRYKQFYEIWMSNKIKLMRVIHNYDRMMFSDLGHNYAQLRRKYGLDEKTFKRNVFYHSSDDDDDDSDDDDVDDDYDYDLTNSTQTFITNANKIWNQFLHTFFTHIFGANKGTRYLHLLCWGSEYWLHLAYELKSTARSLFGTDANEHFNNKIKTLLHVITNKYCTQYKDVTIPSQTIEIIFKYCLWDYYLYRENSSSHNTAKLQKKLQKQQDVRDKKTLCKCIDIINYFEQQKVDYKLEYSVFDNIQKDYNQKYKSFMSDNKDDDDDDDDDVEPRIGTQDIYNTLQSIMNRRDSTEHLQSKRGNIYQMDSDLINSHRNELLTFDDENMNSTELLRRYSKISGLIYYRDDEPATIDYFGM